MKVLDLFSGLGGWSAPFRDYGHEVITLDHEPGFQPDIMADILTWDGVLPWRPDLILASPPCEAFSTAGWHQRLWSGPPSYTPTNRKALDSISLVWATLEHIEQLQPRFFIIENPVGLLRKLPFSGLDEFERIKVTYCQYGEQRMKPTDLWGGFPPSLRFRPPCRNGAPCHVRAPRGSQTGTQGMGRAAAALVPYQLADDVRLAAEHDL